jgi:hypothetical protein
MALRFSPALAASLLLVVGSLHTARKMSAQPDSLELSCAAFSADTTAADLAARFGAANVVTGPVVGLDDGHTTGTILFPDRADARLEIAWQDGESKRWPAWMAARDPAKRWRTPNGIAIGVDLQELQRANGRPFRLAGFQTELEGRVLSWANGRLALAASATCDINVHLQPHWDGTEDFALVRQVRSGREYSSAHPAMQALNPRVVRVSLSFGRHAG